MSGERPPQCSKSLALQLLQPAPAFCSLFAFRSVYLCLHTSRAPPAVFLLSSQGAHWCLWLTSPDSCPLLLEASPPFTLNLRCTQEVCVALRFFSLAEHPDLPGIQGGPAPAWTSHVRRCLKGHPGCRRLPRSSNGVKITLTLIFRVSAFTKLINT